MDPPEDPQLVFYREPSAPDEEIALERGHLRRGARGCDLLGRAARALSAAEPGPTTRAMLEARERRRPHRDRPRLPTVVLAERGGREPRDRRRRRPATVAVGNRAECEVAVGTRDPDAAADALLERGIELAIVKLGGDGVLVATADERHAVGAGPGRGRVRLWVPATRSAARSATHSSSGMSPPEAVEFANAAGAIVASRLLCADAMPTEPEVRELLEDEPRARS